MYFDDQKDKAIECLEEGVKTCPEVWILWQLLGNYRSDQDEFDKAMACYDKAATCPNSDTLFSTYCACAVALIGKLPDTLANRSVSIELRRRLPSEPIEGLRLGRTGHLDELARKAARWTTDNMDRIRDADPAMPSGIFNRAADNWRPLLAIADAAGGEWPARARRAAQSAGAAAASDEQSIKAQLLADIRAIFSERGADRLPSAELVEHLIAIEGRPWAEWKAGKPITANGLARLLGPFGIAPDTIRIGDRTMKGYLLARFDDAFKRYLLNPVAQA